MEILKEVNENLNHQEVNQSDKVRFIYEADKEYEITGAAYFSQRFSFGKIEYTYRKNGKLYAILPRTIHYSGGHDDIAWTDWKEDCTEKASTLIFDQNSFIYNPDSYYSDSTRYDDYVAFEIPEYVDSCQITRCWGIYSGWYEDGKDSYLFTPIIIHFNLNNLLSLPCIDDDILKDGFVIANKEFIRHNLNICTYLNGYNLQLLEEKYNYIETIHPKAFVTISGFDFVLPKSCKKIKEEAFYDCWFTQFTIPNDCEVEIDENAFLDCTINEIHCPKNYEEICKRIFVNSKIIIN